MSVAKYTGIKAGIWNMINHFDYDKYWRMRQYVASHQSGGGVRAWWYLARIKRMDSYHNASLGTHIGFGCAQFEEQPVLPHGLNGRIVTNGAKIGRRCTIYHQVTIGGWDGGEPVIGDNVMIGAGAKIIGGVHIGNNVRIGAGCVVTEDVPDNCTVVNAKARIIERKQ